MHADSPSQHLVGAVLNGRFQLVRLLGEGGMGAVFEAESTRGEGKRAVKLLHQAFVREEQILARFFAEAQATRVLQHPNIAQVLETATAENGTPYLVMELLQGMPLSAYTDQQRAMPPPHALHVIHGVLHALGAAHARGIVHRDIKPANIFLVPDTHGSCIVKVLDFGIAKVMDVAGGMGQKTRTGVLLGTPGYMSPEQVKSSKAVDPRSDLWSVGVLFFELLTGQVPFPGDNEFVRLTRVLSEEPPPIGQVAPALASWAAFFQRALAKDPAHRFQTAHDMAQGMFNTARGIGQPATRSTSPPEASSPTAPGASSPYPAMPWSAGQRPSSASIPRSPLAMSPSGDGALGIAPSATASTPEFPSRANPTLASGASGHALSHSAAVQVHASPIEVIHAPPRLPVGAPWWVVGVVAFVAFGLGLALGMLLS